MHLPSQSRHVERDLFEMLDMEEGRFREIRFSEGENFRDVNVTSPIRLQSPTPEEYVFNVSLMK